MRSLLLVLGCAAADPAAHARGELGFGALDDLSNATDLAGSDLTPQDLSSPAQDLSSPAQDLSSPARDLSSLQDLTPPPPDLTPPPVSLQHVHILIDNQCNTSTSPTEITSPLHQPLEIEYHNHSVDYAADVWLSYIGGFLDLGTGQTWHDKTQHCLNPVPYDAYADVSIAGGGGASCPKFRMMIHCR